MLKDNFNAEEEFIIMNENINNDSLFLDKERNIRKYGIEDLN